MRLFAIVFILLCGTMLVLTPDMVSAKTASTKSSLNPETSDADFKPATNQGVRKADPSLKKACNYRKRIVRAAYDIEFCKKRCLKGDKKFCSCAKDPCYRLDHMDVHEDDAPKPTDKPIDTSDMNCPLQGNFVPAVGAAAEMPWSTMMRLCLEGGKLKTRDGTPAGSAGAQLWTCKALCDRGCRKFCDYCALGYGEPTKIRGNVTMQAQVYCGKGKKPGVGYPGIPEAYAFGNSGVPQRLWKGMFAELEFVNWVALRNAFNAGVLGKADEWSGEPSIAEVTWLAVNQPRRSEFYRKWWWEQIDGGTREKPVVIKGQDKYGYAKSLKTTLQPGLHSYTNPVWGWPFWIDYRP